MFWLAFARKGVLTNRDPLRWCILPITYVGYAWVRGALEGKYAYPFLDVGQLGWLQGISNILLMLIAFLVAGFARVWLDPLMARHSGVT